MFGDGNLWFGMSGLWFVGGADNSPALGEAYASMNPFSTTKYEGVYGSINWTPVPLWASFLPIGLRGHRGDHRLGAVAERIKFSSFIFFSFVRKLIYLSRTGHWIWVVDPRFHSGESRSRPLSSASSATSLVQPSCTPWVAGAALAGVIVLKPRLASIATGRIHPIPGHNMTSAA